MARARANLQTTRNFIFNHLSAYVKNPSRWRVRCATGSEGLNLTTAGYPTVKFESCRHLFMMLRKRVRLIW